MKLVKALLLTLILSGCYGTSSYLDKPLPAKAGDAQIEVINPDHGSREYEIIGEITGDAWMHDIKYFKEEARKLGADAISAPKITPDGYYKACTAYKFKK
jgi:hypothetical protein